MPPSLRLPLRSLRLPPRPTAIRPLSARLHTSTTSDDRHVLITEVGPRDGLQNERIPIPIETKLRLIRDLSSTGLKYIEAGSFVSPKWVPQMAESGEIARVLCGLRDDPDADGGVKEKENATLEGEEDVKYAFLVPNLKGLTEALKYRIPEISVFISASEGFSRKNLNCSVEESLEKIKPVIKLARENGVSVRGYVSMVVACPYDGKTRVEKVGELTGKLVEMGVREVSLGDTIGVAGVESITALLHHLLNTLSIPSPKLACHFHDTYGTALSNTLRALDMGIRSFDSSVGGVGGCPYAKGATGNVATEDLVWMLEGAGMKTGVDLEKLAECGEWVGEVVGRGGSRAGRAVRTRVRAREGKI